MRKISINAIASVNALCVILLLLYVAVHLPTFNMSFYRWQYSVNDTFNVVSMQEDELMAVTQHMLDYMRGRTPNLQIEAIVDGQSRPFFSEREILHMIDVYDLFMLGNGIRNLAAALILGTIALIWFMREPILLTLAKAFRWVSASLIASLAVLTFLIALDFNHAFIIFHEIFFDNDLWLLDPATELLINIVPLQFFITLSSIIAAIFFALLASLFAAASFVCRRMRNSSESL